MVHSASLKQIRKLPFVTSTFHSEWTKTKPESASVWYSDAVSQVLFLVAVWHDAAPSNLRLSATKRLVLMPTNWDRFLGIRLQLLLEHPY